MSGWVKWLAVAAALVLAYLITRITLPVHSVTRQFAAIDEAVPGLPDVLLIGDSIAIRYGPQVRRELKGKANVYLLTGYLPQRLHTLLLTPLVEPVNAATCANILRRLDEWLGERAWDVIHFNCGLHVIPRAGSDSEPFRRAARLYEETLDEIVTRLERTRARLVFATTTPVPAASGRSPENVVRFNEIAGAVMKRRNVSVNDLYSFALPRIGEIQSPGDIHFHLAGSQALAEAVARHIKNVALMDQQSK